MKTLPEDGSLEEITASDLNSEINLMIIQIPEELVEPNGPKYAIATLDRSKEGVEWPADQILEKLVPGLPKVKVPETSQTEDIIKTNSQHRHSNKRKFYQRPFHKRDSTSTFRSKPPHKRFRSDRAGNFPTNDIEPWVCKPWENQALFTGMNTTASVSATPLISSEHFSNFHSPTSSSSFPLSSGPIRNIFNAPNNNNTYEKGFRPTAASNIQFVNNHIRDPNRPPLINRMPLGPPSFQIQNRFSQHPNRGPVINSELNDSSHQTSLLGKPSVKRHQVKHGLLGDMPFPNMPFNRNSDRFPSSLSAHSNLEGNATTLFLDEKNGSEQSNSFNKSPYDAGYGRNSKSNFDQYEDKNKISNQEPYDSYKYPNNMVDDSRTNSFGDASKTSYNRYHNSASAVDRYEDQYRDSYNHLSHNHPKKIKEFSNNSRGSHKTNYKRFRKPSARVGHSKNGYNEVDVDNQCKRNYDGRVSDTSKATFAHNQNDNLKEDSLIHLSNSAVVYNPEDFQNDAYPATTTNSFASQSNLNLGSRPSIRRNMNNKNMLEKRRTTSKFANNNHYRFHRGKYNQGPRRYRPWKSPRK